MAEAHVVAAVARGQLLWVADADEAAVDEDAEPVAEHLRALQCLTSAPAWYVHKRSRRDQDVRLRH